MGELKKVSSMVLNTAEGKREIQLFFGDITKLPVEEKVDVVMVSAGQGDYAASRSSVIGALKHNLGISVRDLARHKEECLVKNFCCWWSKPLPCSVPYRRLLCFERAPSQVGHPSRLVGEVFRAMLPAFNNQESTVITPLLAAGDQRFAPDVMLAALVNAAANWIRHGLPLTCLKVVIFYEDVRLLKLFSELKTKWESLKSDIKDPPIVHDVYLSYCKKDSEKAVEIENLLRSEKPDIRIYAGQQSIVEDETFQERIYNVMISCVKVVAVLSPAYLQSSECLEQFNIALCCDRKTRREMLAPFYTETIPALPTYMCMVQYIDVRIHDGSLEAMMTGCRIFVEMVNNIVADHVNDLSQVTATQMKYDVFISYSHRNTEHATELFTILQRRNPELRIFFDRNELTLGSTWQQTLYYAVDGARCMLALMSVEYLKSLVCTEEYNLALAKHMCWEKGGDTEFYLIPITIESIAEIPSISSKVPIIDARPRYRAVISKVVADVDKWLTCDILNSDVFSPVETPLNLADIMEKHRGMVVRDTIKNMNLPPPNNQTGTLSVGFSFAKFSEKYANYLNKLLKCIAPDVKTTFAISNDSQLVCALEQCDLIIGLISPCYMITRKTTDEFHHALARHRSSKNGPVVYPIQMGTLPFNPLFYQLVPCSVNCDDEVWRDSIVINTLNQLLKKLKIDINDQVELGLLSQTFWGHEILALSFASVDIISIVRAKSLEQRQNVVLDNIVKMDVSTNESTSSQADETIIPDDQFFKTICTAGIGESMMTDLISTDMESDSEAEFGSSGDLTTI